MEKIKGLMIVKVGKEKEFILKKLDHCMTFSIK